MHMVSISGAEKCMPRCDGSSRNDVSLSQCCWNGPKDTTGLTYPARAESAGGPAKTCLRHLFYRRFPHKQDQPSTHAIIKRHRMTPSKCRCRECSCNAALWWHHHACMHVHIPPCMHTICDFANYTTAQATHDMEPSLPSAARQASWMPKQQRLLLEGGRNPSNYKRSAPAIGSQL